MKQHVHADLPAYGARAQTNAREKRAQSRLRNAALGLCAEVGLALGFAAVGFVLSLLCGW